MGVLSGMKRLGPPLRNSGGGGALSLPAASGPHFLKNDGFVFFACAYEAKGVAFFGKKIARETSPASQMKEGRKRYRARFLTEAQKRTGTEASACLRMDLAESHVRVLRRFLLTAWCSLRFR